jgi:hypothetical protein
MAKEVFYNPIIKQSYDNGDLYYDNEINQFNFKPLKILIKLVDEFQIQSENTNILEEIIKILKNLCIKYFDNSKFNNKSNILNIEWENYNKNLLKSKHRLFHYTKQYISSIDVINIISSYISYYDENSDFDDIILKNDTIYELRLRIIFLEELFRFNPTNDDLKRGDIIRFYSQYNNNPYYILDGEKIHPIVNNTIPTIFKVGIDFPPDYWFEALKNMYKCYFWLDNSLIKNINFKYDEFSIYLYNREYTIKIILINFSKYDKNKIQEYLQNIYKSRNNLLINYVHLGSILELTINY